MAAAMRPASAGAKRRPADEPKGEIDMRMRYGLAALGLSFAVAACQTPNQGQNLAGGAAIGALGGAALGGLIDSDEPLRGALIGGGIGALAGGAIGSYLDAQQEELNQQLAGTGVDVQRQGQQLVIVMPGDVTFDFDSDRIRPNFYGVLDDVAATLIRYDQSYVQIIGHTDSTGSDAYNLQLSERRADAVAAYLNRRGVAAQRIQVGGAGETQPKASNATEAGRAANRRVEITIIPYN